MKHSLSKFLLLIACIFIASIGYCLQKNHARNLPVPPGGRQLVIGRSLAIFYHDQLGETIFINGIFDPGVWHTKYIELWKWKNNNWELLSDSGPEARNCFAWAYNTANGKLVIYGGSANAGGNRKWYNDTWEWDGKNWKQSETPVNPGVRSFAGMVYDPVRKACVLFGGINEKFDLLGDTWTYDGKEWKQILTNGPARRPASFFYLPGTGKVYLYGGHTQIDPTHKGLTDDTWELNETGWKQVMSAVTPGKREGANTVYNGRTKSIWMVGGSSDAPEPRFVADTWTFNGREWELVQLKGLPPRDSEGLIYDPRTKTITAQSGFNVGGGPGMKDTWILKPGKKEWECISGCNEELKQWIVDHPDDGDALLVLVATLYYQHKPDEVIKQILESVNTRMAAASYRKLASYLFRIKQYKAGTVCYEKILAREPGGADFFNLACGYSKNNEKEKALDALENAVKYGYAAKANYEKDTDLDSLRTDERFKAILGKLK